MQSIPNVVAAQQPAEVSQDHFSAAQQKQWRSTFSVIINMADDWLDLPAQRKMKVTSRRLHAEYIAFLSQYHKQWELMNPGGQWS